MADEPEVIRQQMEETRAALAEKLDALGQRTVDTVQATTEQVTETVEAVQESVEGTVATVREAFDLNAWVDKYPWLVVGGAAAVGFLLGRAFAPAASEADTGPAPSMPPADRWLTDGKKTDGHTGNGGRPVETPPEESKPPQPKSGWLGDLLEKFGPEFDQFKGLAIGATLGVVRDLVTQGETGDLGNKVSEVIDHVTEKLGGTPISGRPPSQTGDRKPEAKQKDERKPTPAEGGRMAEVGSRKGEQGGRPDRYRS